MVKNFTVEKIRNMYEGVFGNWEEVRLQTKLSARQMFFLIDIKNKIVAETDKIRETLTSIAEGAGAEPLPNGGYKIPDDKIEEVDKEIVDFIQTEISIEFTPVELRDSDSVPIPLIDALFDFFIVKD